MNKTLLLILVILTPFTLCFSQNITVLDASTKLPIPYVAVKIGNNKGLYTDEQGKFSINSNSVDFLKMTHLTYNDLYLEVKEIKDTIFMIPKITVLDEIIITKTGKPTLILEPQKTANNFGNFPLLPKHELITVICPGEKIVNTVIKEISFSFSKNIEKMNEKEKYQSIDAIVRINVYKAKSDTVGDKIYSSLPLKVSSYLKQNISLDLTENAFELTKEGLCFGIEMIGYSDGTQMVEDKQAFVRPSLTERQNKSFSSVTYMKYVFDDVTNLISVSDMLKKGSPNKEIERNLVVGLTVIPE